MSFHDEEDGEKEDEHVNTSDIEEEQEEQNGGDSVHLGLFCYLQKLFIVCKRASLYAPFLQNVESSYVRAIKYEKQ